jgi:hypothetical protein
LSYEINDDDSVTINGVTSLSLNAINGEIPIKIDIVNTLFLHNAKTLENSPNQVNFAFNISDCKNITSLKNGPKRIGKFLHLGSLYIDDFSDLPRPIEEGYLVTTNNMYMGCLLSIILKPRYTTSGRKESGYFKVDNEVCDNIELFTDYDPIRPNHEYSLSRLNQYLDAIGQNQIDELEYWKNID